MPDNLPAVVREVDRKDLVETFVVHDHGKRYEVAANALALKAQQQMTVGRLHALCERTIKVYEDNPELVPSPKELKIIAEACSTVAEMGNTAYGDSKTGGKYGDALERLAVGLMKGAVEASGGPRSNSPDSRMARLSSVGKAKKAEAKAIEAKAAEVEVVEEFEPAPQ